MSTLRASRPVAVLLLVVLWPTLGLAQSASPAGVVTGLQGRATLVRPVIAQPIPLKFKDDLFLHDEVETRENSVARVLLGGKALVTIRELSTFTITEEPGRAAVDLKTGKIAVGVAKSLLRRGEVIEIRTPNAIAAVRGSLLVAAVTCLGGPLGDRTCKLGVPQSSFTALDASLPITVTPLGGTALPAVLSVNQAVQVSGIGASITVGPVQNVTPDVARREAQTASAPRAADGQGTASPMAAEISAARTQEATVLASLIAPPTTGATPAPADATLAAAAQPQMLAESGSTLTAAAQTVVSSIPPPPSTGDLGVNEVAAEVGSSEIAQSSPPSSATPPASGTPPGGSPPQFNEVPPDGGVTPPGSGTPPTGGPVVVSGQNLALAANQTLKTYSGQSVSTDPAAAVTVTNSTVTGAGNLIVVEPGANASLAGPLLNVTGPAANPSALVAASGVVDIRGVMSSMTTESFISIDPTDVSTSDFLRIVGGNLTLVGPLLDLTNTAVNITGALVRLEGGSLLQSDGVKVTGGSLTADALVSTDGLGNTLTVRGTALDLANTTATLGTLARQPAASTDTVAVDLALQQPALRLSSSALTLTDVNDTVLSLGADVGPVPTIPGVGVISDGTAAAPSTLNLKGTLFELTGANATANQALVQLDQTTVVQTDTANDLISVVVPAGLTTMMASRLLSATNSTINTSGRLVHFSGEALGNSSTAPFLLFDASGITSGQQMIQLDGGFNLTLSGPLVSAQSTGFHINDPSVNASGFVAILDGAKLTSGGILPLLTFDASSFDGGNILTVRRSASAVDRSTLTLAGPLFSATNGSSFNTSSSGLGLTLGAAGGPCCSLASVTQGGQLSSTTLFPLIQVTGSTVNAGPDTQSGGNIVNIADTFGNAPAAELVAPSSVALAGPLLRSDNSTLTALFHLLRVGNSSLVSTSPDPLIQINNSTVNLGGFDPFANATSPGRLLNLSGSAVSPAMLTLQGPLFSAVNSALSSTGSMFGVFDNAMLTSSTSNALISIDGGSALAAVSAPGGNFITVASGLGVPPTISLAGPLLAASNTTLRNGNPLGNAFSYLFIGDSSQVTSSGAAPFLDFDHTNVDTTGNLLSLRRSLSVAGPTRLTLENPGAALAGPLVSAVDSTFNTTSLTFGSACCDGFGVRQAAALKSETTEPLIELTRSNFYAGPNPLDPVPESGGNFFGMSDTGPDGPVTAPATVSLAGPLLRASDNSSISALFDLLSIVRSNFTSTAADPLIQINNSTVSLGGLDPFTNVTTTARILDLSGSLAAPGTLELRGPLFRAVASDLMTTSESFGIFAGGLLTQTKSGDPLITLQGGTVVSGGHFIHARGFAAGGSLPGGLTLSGPLLSMTGTSMGVTGNLLRLADAGFVSSETTAPLISLSGGSFTGAPAGSVRGGSLLRMFSEVGQAGTALSVVGPYLSATGTTYSAPDASAFSITDGASIMSKGLEPFASFSGGSASTAGTFGVMANNTSFTVPGQPTVLGNGIVPTFSLAGPFLSFSGTSVVVGNPIANTASLMFIADGSTLTSTGLGALLSFDAANVDLAGNVLTLRRSAAVAIPSKLTLSGALFSAVNDSSFNTTSLGFGASFGVAGACCNGFFIGQGAELIQLATTPPTPPTPLIQLSNASFYAGPDAQSGGSFFGVYDTFSGAPAGDLIAPAVVTLAGPLIEARSTSTINALFNLVDIQRSSVSLSSPNSADPLIRFDTSTMSLGGTNQADGALSVGRLLHVRSSATAETVGSPASVTLSGPVLSANNSNLTMTSDLIGVFNGASLSSATATPLVALNGGSVTTSVVSGVGGSVLDVGGRGGPAGDGFATATFDGSLLSATDSMLTLGGSFINVPFVSGLAGGQITTNGVANPATGSVDPLVLIIGGNHTIGSIPEWPMFRLFGRSAAAAQDPTAETNLMLGTDRPLQGALLGNGTRPVTTPLLETRGATISGQKIAQFDTLLLEATAPLLNLTANGAVQSALTTSGTNAMDLSFRAQVSALGSSLIRLDNSVLNVANGSLVNVNASKLTVSGDLVSLLNGAKLTLGNGSLLNVQSGGFAGIGGALVSFGGTGGNTISVTNALAPTGFINGVPVFSSLGGVTGFSITNPTPLVGLNTLGTITINGVQLPSNATAASGISGSLIGIQGTGGQVKIGPQ
jgi:hypothetical protein